MAKAGEAFGRVTFSAYGFATGVTACRASLNRSTIALVQSALSHLAIS
jgi:hypothetical protein